MENGNLLEELLRGLPTEEFHDPNIGTYEDAVLSDAKVYATKSGRFSANMTFETGVGTRFASFLLPQSGDHALVGKKARDWQRALGIIAPDAKDARLANSAEAAEQLVNAIKVVATGHTIPYQTTERGDFLNHTPLQLRK